MVKQKLKVMVVAAAAVVFIGKGNATPVLIFIF